VIDVRATFCVDRHVGGLKNGIQVSAAYGRYGERAPMRAIDDCDGVYCARDKKPFRETTDSDTSITTLLMPRVMPDFALALRGQTMRRQSSF
jgi:hypothetical protein